MKLHLSSYRVPVPNALRQLLHRPFHETKAAIIPNAKDHNPTQERIKKLNELTNDLRHLGFKLNEVDLKQYADPQKLLEDLRRYHLVWVAGGNTFVLRQAMHDSGFDRIAHELLADGRTLYAGESAGAIVAGASLRGSETADDIQATETVVLDGLKLVNKIIAPHADSPDYPDYIVHMEKLYQRDDRLLKLNDNQAFIVDGSRHEVVTA